MQVRKKKKISLNGYSVAGKASKTPHPAYYLMICLLALPLLYSCNKQDDDVYKLPAYDFSALDSMLNKASVQQRFTDGMSIVLQKKGKIIYENAFGTLDTQQPMQVASCSKWVSAAVILSLVDDGLIQLDDSIGKYLPVFTLKNKGQVTIRQCFTMTSGFEECLSGKYGCPIANTTITLQQATEQLAETQPLVYTPGTTVYYSSVGMHIVGRIAELVTGKSWAILFKERIADPCAMQVSSYGDTDNAYIAGGLQTVPADYLNFLQMILDYGVFGQKRVLSEEAIEVFFTPQTRKAQRVESPYPTPPPYHPYDAKLVYYGFGSWQDVVNPDTDEIERISQPGAFGTFPWVDRKRNMIGIIFTNSVLEETISSELKMQQLIRETVDTAEMRVE